MARIRAFDKSDSDRLTREEDLNNLESKIYRIRDQLEDTEFTSFASAPMIKDVQRLVKSTSQWLSDSSHSATSEMLKERRKALEEIIAPIALRRSEAAKRPELTKLLRDALTQAKGLVTMIEDSINVAARRSSELAEASASSSSSASEASSATDPLADLEQTESSAAPQPTDNPLSFLPVYTADDLKTVKSAYESTNVWFEAKLAEQEKLLPYEDAAFTSTELEAKAKELNDGLMKLLQQKLKATENAAKAQEKARKAQEKKEKEDKKKAEKKAKEEASKATESQTKEKSSSTTAAASESSGKDEL
jgi:hypoxia up-regulated 1